MDESTTERVPTTAPRFAAHFRVRYYEVDLHGHVHNTVYLHYLEQAAAEHAVAAGFGGAKVGQSLGGVWLVRRHEVDYLLPAVESDLLQVWTWAEEMRGARAFRRYVIYRLPPDADTTDRFLPPAAAPPGPPLVEAYTLWVWFDTATNRPRRIPPEVIAAFVGPPHRDCYGFLRERARATFGRFSRMPLLNRVRASQSICPSASQNCVLN